ncbi:MAG: hypothetical protein IPH18_15680 [Chitinophagaceae bacterium]|nr:hypothetical protein [Chitinophagaceae bacterium]
MRHLRGTNSTVYEEGTDISARSDRIWLLHFSQQPLQQIRKKSYQTFLYRIPADTAEKYLQKE